MMPGMPIMVMKEGTRREEGKNALEQNISAGAAIAKTVRTTLGPKGMDKMLVDADGETIITNDGVTILKEVDVEHPAAKMVVEAAKTQDEECGDGTTSAVILIGELLEKALPLIKKGIHPTVITEGYHTALMEAYRTIEGCTYLLEDELDRDTSQVVRNIAQTAMTGKHTSEYSGILSEFVVQAITWIQDRTKDDKIRVDLDRVSVIKQPGRSAEESEIIPGVIVHMGRLSKAMPREAKGARVALFNCPLSVQETDRETNMEINSAEELREMISYEEEKIKEMVEAFEFQDLDVVLTTKAVSDPAIQELTEAGIIAVSRIPEEDMENISLLTKSRINTTWKNWDKKEDVGLGTVDHIEEVTINRDPYMRIEGVYSAPVRTVLLRGASDQILDELERGFHDAITTAARAYEDGEFVVGGGSVYAEISKDLHRLSKKSSGRESYAIEAFADACASIPAVLAENAGMDAIDAEIALTGAHAEGRTHVGVDVKGGEVRDIASSICEPTRVVSQALKIAAETAAMVLRIDDIIAMSPGDLGQQPQQGGR